MSTFAIVGGGVAGVTAARALATTSPNDEVHIFSAEPYPYYPRPYLWRFIAGEMEQEDLYFQPLSWYEEKGIRFHMDARVAAVDADEHRLRLSGGDDVTYDRLLLANGARPFVPPFKGTDKKGVFTLRTLDDARAIKEYAARVSQAVVIGGGLLGLETARALQDAGPAVRVIEIADYLLPRQLDQEGAQVLRALLEEQGLELTTGAVVEAVLGDGRAESVRTEDGRVVEGELVLFSAGIRCRVKLAREAGLEVNRGVVVDEQMRTSAEDVFAAGDVAEFKGKVYGIIPPAIEQAEIAAANMIDVGSEVYTGTLTTTTLEVAGARVTSLGEYNPGEGDAVGGPSFRVLRRADAGRGRYRKFVLRDGRVIGAILVNEPQRAAITRVLIDREIDVSEHADHLVDDDFDLKSLL
jgi:nitrite reductase (NADH) large subunit